MTRLAAYLVRIFSADALALFAIVSFLLYMAQALRTFDVVTVKGQDLGTLAYQTMLSMPELIIAFAHLCIGIGLARGLGLLQQSHELHIIHTSRRTSALFGAMVTYTGVSVALVLLLSNFIDPLTQRQYGALQSDIAADLVRRTLTPNRFIEMTPGVTLVIGSRGQNGEIGSFFADDRREEARRTYIAETATLAVDDRGYVIKLRNGRIQNMSANQRYSEIEFATYDLAIDRISRAEGAPSAIEMMTTPEIVAAIAGGDTSGRLWRTAGTRLGEGLKTLALCAMVAAFAAFPRGERRGTRWLPLEIVVIIMAFVERLVSGYAPLAIPNLPFTGSVLIIAGSLAVLAWRLRALAAPRPVLVR